MACTKGATENESFFDIPELDTHIFENYDGLSTDPLVGPFVTNYIYANTHHLISISLYISVILTDTYTTYSLVRYCINGLPGRNQPVDVKKLCKLLLFKTDNIVINTIEATTQISGFNQCPPTSQYNKRFPCRGPHWHKDGDIYNLFYSVKSHDGTISVELIFGTKTLTPDVYAIVSKSGLNIDQVLQERFRERGIPISICYDNVQ